MTTIFCNGCYSLTIGMCGDTFKVPTGLADGIIIWAVITDKFGTEYRIKAEVDADGNVELDKSKFPEGLFTPYSGVFKFEILGTGETEPSDPVCNITPVTICGTEWPCVSIRVAEREFSDHTDPVPPSECVCGYAFGSADTQVNIVNDSGWKFQTEIFTSATDFLATGNFVNLAYQINEYKDEVLVYAVNGVLGDGDSTTEQIAIPNNDTVVFQVSTTATFDDGAVTTTTKLYEVTRSGADITVVSTEYDTANLALVGCETLEAEYENPRIDGGDGTKTINPEYVDGDGTQLVAGSIYNDTIPNGVGWPYTMAWVFGIDVTQWPDLPQDMSGGSWAGNYLTFSRDCA